MARFDGQTVLITGGFSGIGLATAQLFLQEGAHVMIGGRGTERAEAVRRRLASHEGRLRLVNLDVTNADDIDNAFSELDGWRGRRVDAVVANAGVNAPGLAADITVEDFDRCIDTNFRGVFLAAQAAIPRMQRAGGGSLVFMSSNGGLIARASDPVYCASKAAVIMLARAMALGYAQDNIRVNAVCPGPVSGTEMVERGLRNSADPDKALVEQLAAAPLAAVLGRMITPEEVGELVLYLCSDLGSMITGAAIPIDAGKSAGIRR